MTEQKIGVDKIYGITLVSDNKDVIHIGDPNIIKKILVIEKISNGFRW